MYVYFFVCFVQIPGFVRLFWYICILPFVFHSQEDRQKEDIRIPRGSWSRPVRDGLLQGSHSSSCNRTAKATPTACRSATRERSATCHWRARHEQLL